MSQIKISEESFKFESEILESYWVTYSNNFNLRFNINNGSLSKFKKFINSEPHKNDVLKRLSTSVLDFDETIAMKRIYKLLRYIQDDYFVNFNKFVSSVEDYGKKHKSMTDTEIVYNKLSFIRSVQDGENIHKKLENFYNYYIQAVSKVYEFVYNKKPENNNEILNSFEELYVKIDINIRLYHYDFYIEIFNMLNKVVIKIITVIYDDQSGCCVATPAFNILDILIETLRNLATLLREI